jgi:CheY-like chemotaxis protein
MLSKVVSDEDVGVIRSHKLEMVGHLTGGVAHDINNLLTAILLNSDVLAARVGDKALSALAETTRMSAERAGDLTRQLLAFVREQRPPRRLTDVNASLRTLSPLLQRTIGEHINLTVETDAQPAPVQVDPARLETAILNLAVNARDAMPRGGRLLIRTRRMRGPGDAHWMVIAVADTGVGMPPDVVARVLEPFFTTKPEGCGTGLGLSLVHTLAREAGGRLRIVSRPGAGTAVTLLLPAAPATAAAPPWSVRPPPCDLSGTESILLVEDDRIVRAHVETTLLDLGYRVTAVAAAAQALEHVTGRTDLDLLFTDIVMPGGITGHELAARARLRHPGLRVLYTSGYPPQSDLTAYDHHSAFLAKPFRRAELGLALRALLEKAAA